LPVHSEEEQVGKDTNRSFVSYPRGQLLLFAQVVDETDIRYPTRIQDGDEGRSTCSHRLCSTQISRIELFPGQSRLTGEMRGG
jgi:hypothetical protein